jgi:hypothetical protein
LTSWIIGSTYSSQVARLRRNAGAAGSAGRWSWPVRPRPPAPVRRCRVFQHVAHAHVEQAQLARQVVAVAVVEGVLDVAGQAFEVAQVGFDLQAQAQPVFAAQVGEEVVDLRVELETVRALATGTRMSRRIHTSSRLVMSCGVLSSCWAASCWRSSLRLRVPWSKCSHSGSKGPVFGEGAQDALGFDHWNGRLVGD